MDSFMKANLKTIILMEKVNIILMMAFIRDSGKMG
jgi:hypothetical protein